MEKLKRARIAALKRVSDSLEHLAVPFDQKCTAKSSTNFVVVVRDVAERQCGTRTEIGLAVLEQLEYRR